MSTRTDEKTWKLLDKAWTVLDTVEEYVRKVGGKLCCVLDDARRAEPTRREVVETPPGKAWRVVRVASTSPDKLAVFGSLLEAQRDYTRLSGVGVAVSFEATTDFGRTWVSADIATGEPANSAGEGSPGMCDSSANEAVDAIVADICNRRGLRQEWENVDAVTQDEIRQRWVGIIESVLGEG